MLALTILVSLATASPASASPAAAPPATAPPEGAVIVGVATNDGASTTVRIVAPDGAARDVATIAHRTGSAPIGVLDGGDVLLTVERAGAAASVVRVSLDDGVVTDLAEGALATAPPIPLDDGVAFVRAAAKPGAFEVVVARGAVVELAATIDAASVVPVRGARSLQLMVVDAKGGARIVRVVAGGGVEDVGVLGKGPHHGPCHDGARIVVERAVPTPISRKPLADVRARALGKARTAGASLVDAGTGKTIASAVQVGMSPACGDGVVAYTTGAKDGTLQLDGKPPVKVRSGRKGVARPQAVAVLSGQTVVVVRVDAGAAQLAETWRIDDGGRAARLVDPAEGGVVQVYGVVHAAPAVGPAPR